MAKWDDLHKKFRWMTRGENCGICQAMAGRVYTYDTWISAAILPGFHLYCNCYLVQVSEDIPESDKDIFGSDFNIRLDNKYFLSLNYNYAGLPYNVRLADAVDSAMNEGLSMKEALSRSRSFDLGGLFEFFPQRVWDIFPQWRVFRALKHSIDGTLTTTLTPTVTVPAAVNPSTTYKYNKNWD